MRASFLACPDGAVLEREAPYPERRPPRGSALDDVLLRVAGLLDPGPALRGRGGLGGRDAWVLRDVAARASRFSDLADRRLAEAAAGLRGAVRRERPWMADVFALTREVAWRTLGLRPFPVQLLGGAAMCDGALAEMQTGEGKTLTAAFPAVAAALCGRTVHIVTVNDYLAGRDAAFLGPLFATLGLSVGTVRAGQSHGGRQRAYAADVTYCSNKELVFDYLRDRRLLGSRRGADQLVLDEAFGAGPIRPRQRLLLRGLEVAIVDEADSILIDEARTPLILSGKDGGADDEGTFHQALEIARLLEEGRDFRRLPNERRIALSDAGTRQLARLAQGLGGLWSIRRAREELAGQALTSLHLFRRDSQYIVERGKVCIVDEFTGRVMPDRAWEHGLHQMVEAKEGCDITGRNVTLARTTYQTFFRSYLHLSGMTGTARETRAELKAVYGLDVVPIPTNRPLRRTNGGARLYRTADAKLSAIARSAAARTRAGRAVLIGTRSVEASDRVAAHLARAGLDCVVLNARQDREEAEIVAAAGRPGRITVATNMAGRGTDILLEPRVRAAGGLHVILTEFHESRRIDRQLFGRAGRQGDRGSFEAIVSLEDEIFVRFLGGPLRRLASRTGPAAAAVPGTLARCLRMIAQARAERLNGRYRRAAVAAEQRARDFLAFAGRE